MTRTPEDIAIAHGLMVPGCAHLRMTRVAEGPGEATYHCPDCGLTRVVPRAPKII